MNQHHTADTVRIELVTAIHSLASDFENSLYAFGDDAEARKKAEGDIAHAMSIAAKHNQNGSAIAAQTHQQAQGGPSATFEAIKAALFDYENAVEGVIATQEGDDPHAAVLAVLAVEKAQEVLKTWAQPEYLRQLVNSIAVAPQPAQGVPDYHVWAIGRDGAPFKLRGSVPIPEGTKLAAATQQAERFDWSDYRDITDIPAVDEAIRALLEDQTEDNAACLVRAIVEAAGDRLVSLITPQQAQGAPSFLRLGVAATKQGATVCLMQPHLDGSVTVIHSGTHPIGDTGATVCLAAEPTSRPAGPVAGA